MTTSTHEPAPTDPRPARLPLRLSLEAPEPGLDGAWWPQSRVLQDEAADLVDHFPTEAGRISRLLFSRPDWDNSFVGQHGVRKITAARGVVKVGSFPRDDTHVMVLTLSSGARLTLLVIAPDTEPSEARRLLG